MSKGYIDHNNPEWLKMGEDTLSHVMNYTGKQRNKVSSPSITAHECIALADVLKLKFNELRCWQRAWDITTHYRLSQEVNCIYDPAIQYLGNTSQFALAYAIAQAEQDGVSVLEGGTE